MCMRHKNWDKGETMNVTPSLHVTLIYVPFYVQVSYLMCDALPADSPLNLF